MPANAKEVRQRLQSIRNTTKITKAMELVAAAKMRKAAAAALQTRLYHGLAWNVVEKILSSRRDWRAFNPTRRFFEKIKEPRHTTIVVFTSNRGLCGAFNANIAKLVLEFIETRPAQSVSVVSVGNKGTAAFASLGMKIDFALKKEDSASDDSHIIPLADFVYNKFLNGETDLVLVAYTDWRSMLTQKPRLRQLFPLVDRQEDLTEPEPAKEELLRSAQAIGERNYLFEPNKFEVLGYLVPRLAEVELYQALLESNASEHSARMLAMKNATEAASEMAEELTLEHNKARQAAITKEIAEISAGSAAIS